MLKRDKILHRTISAFCFSAVVVLSMSSALSSPKDGPAAGTTNSGESIPVQSYEALLSKVLAHIEKAKQGNERPSTVVALEIMAVALRDRVEGHLTKLNTPVYSKASPHPSLKEYWPNRFIDTLIAIAARDLPLNMDIKDLKEFVNARGNFDEVKKYGFENIRYFWRILDTETKRSVYVPVETKIFNENFSGKGEYSEQRVRNQLFTEETLIHRVIKAEGINPQKIRLALTYQVTPKQLVARISRLMENMGSAVVYFTEGNWRHQINRPQIIALTGEALFADIQRHLVALEPMLMDYRLQALRMYAPEELQKAQEAYNVERERELAEIQAELERQRSAERISGSNEPGSCNGLF